MSSPDTTASLTIQDSFGETHVFLHRPSGEHIVTRHTRRKDGFEDSNQIALGSEAWERAVARAERGAVFL